MNTIEIVSAPSVSHNDGEFKVQRESPSFQHLLDVISSIIAEEYIAIAKQNPEVFSREANK